MRQHDILNLYVAAYNSSWEIPNKIFAVNLWDEIDVAATPDFNVLSCDYLDRLIS